MRAEPSRLGLKGLLRRSASLSSASLIGSLVAGPTSFVVARWLGPRDLGRVEFVLLFYFYASLLRTGTFEGGIRSYIALKSKGDGVQARRAHDVAVTFESLASLIPGLILAGVALSLRDPVRREGLLLAPVAVGISSLASYAGGMLLADERFGEVAAANLIRAVLVPLLVLVGIVAIGPSAVFLAPPVGDAAALLFCMSRGVHRHLHPRFDRATWAPLVRTGFPLGALGVVYWAYRLVGSTSLAIARSPTVFGYYSFAAGPVAALAAAIAGVHAVLTPTLWTALAKDDSSDWEQAGARVTLALGLIGGAATSLCQAAFLPLVLLVAKGFAPASPLLEILAFNVFLLSVGAVPSLLLSSTRVNRQKPYLILWLCALGLNAAANVVALATGHGATAIAVNDIWIQIAALVAVFAMAWRHFHDVRLWRRCVALLSAEAVWTGLVGLVIHALHRTGHDGAVIGLLCVRCLVAVALWSPIGIWYLHRAGWRRGTRRLHDMPEAS